MAKKDITMAVGMTAMEGMSSFINESGDMLGLEKEPAPRSDEPEAQPEAHQEAPVAERPKGGPAARKQVKYTSVRLTDQSHLFLSRAVQCYRIATGRSISLGDFIELSVRRALPHISKEAYQILSSIQKDQA